MHACRSFIDNHERLGTAKMYFNRRMDKQAVIHPHRYYSVIEGTDYQATQRHVNLKVIPRISALSLTYKSFIKSRSFFFSLQKEAKHNSLMRLLGALGGMVLGKALALSKHSLGSFVSRFPYPNLSIYLPDI